MNGIVLTLAMIAASPADSGPISEFIERIELNHMHDGNWQPTSSQIIFWDRTGERLEVIDHEPWSEGDSIPEYNRTGRYYYHSWIDYYDDHRHVKAWEYIETWTQYPDPEGLANDIWPRQLRRRLLFSYPYLHPIR